MSLSFSSLYLKDQTNTATGIYISWLQFHHFATNFRGAISISIQDRIIPYRDTVKISEGSPLVLEVNIEKAWKEMGLVAGVGNEVEVVLHVLCDAQRRRSMFDEA